MTTTREGTRHVTVADFRATREGRWYVLRMFGTVVARRYTREDCFTSVWVPFQSNGTKREHQVCWLETQWNGREHVPRVVWRGPWPVGRHERSWARDHIDIPIERTTT